MLLSSFLILACANPTPVDTSVEPSDTDTDTDTDTGTGTGTDTGTDTDMDTDPQPVCTEPTEVGCIDEMILDLSLHDDLVSDGEVDNEADGNDWVTGADASAGGMNDADQNPWLYLRFTDSGMERVDIDDESALEEMSWHLAARRYVLRVNSGTSGPSCVGVAKARGNYADVTLADAESATFAYEEFYTEECEIIEDNSMLPGSLDVALGSWWEYTASCVATTDQAFVLQLDDGQLLKFTVESYYKGEGQTECNEEGSTNNGSGQFTFRWQVLG
jgi:hypothetical protein